MHQSNRLNLIILIVSEIRTLDLNKANSHQRAENGPLFVPTTFESQFNLAISLRNGAAWISLLYLNM